MDIMNVIEVAVLFLAVATLGAALNLKFEDCGTGRAKVESIDVEPCQSDPCPLHHGYTYTTRITFTANEDTNTATAKMDLKVLGMHLPFPIPPDACKSGLTCPVKKGSVQTATAHMYCKPTFPKVKMTGRFRIIDDKGNDMVCITVPLRITN